MLSGDQFTVFDFEKPVVSIARPKGTGALKIFTGSFDNSEISAKMEVGAWASYAFFV
jgi:hypothetical protein